MRSEARSATTVATVALLLLGADGMADDTAVDVSFSSGVEYSSGKYGGSNDIEDLYVPLTLRLDYDKIGLRLTVPYLSVSTEETVQAAGTGQTSGAEAQQTVTESGLGDVIAALTIYDVYVSDEANAVIDLTGKIKFGTADESKDLGTGENDYTVQVDAYRFFDRWTLQGSAGYRFRGEPASTELDNALLGSVGGTYAAPGSALLGLYYDFRESSLPGRNDVEEVSGFASFRLSSAWRLELYAFTGLTDSSADFGGGLNISTDLSQLRARQRQDF